MTSAEADDDDDKGNAEGGALRSALRSIFQRVSKTAVGAIPQNPKALAKQADRFSDLLDHAIHVSVERKQLENQQHAKEKPRRFMKFATSVVNALPSIAKSSVLGGALFSAYDLSLERASQHFSHKSTILPTLAGGAGGAVHGLMSVAWDKTYWHTAPLLGVKRIPSLSVSLPGTVLAHSILHASLFGSYYIIKETLLPMVQIRSTEGRPREDDARLQVAYNLGAVTVAGGIAGSLAEFIGYYLNPLEKGVALKMLPLPAMRPMLFAAIPSGIGFLAFEFST